MTDSLALADELLDALERYDADAVEKLVDPGLVHWINLTQQEQGADGLLATLRLERDVVAAATFRVRHRVASAEGFVLQLDVDGTTKKGSDFHIPVCLVVAVDGGRITRIDEYANSDHVKPLLAELFGGAS